MTTILESLQASDNTLLSKRTFAVSAGQTLHSVSNQYSDAGFDFEITETPIVVLLPQFRMFLITVIIIFVLLI
jgi:uncharacterized membrane protein YadS